MDRQALLVGVLGGVGVGLLSWYVIENRVRAALREEIPVQVQETMATQLSELGLTPRIASVIRQTAEGLDHVGVL